MFGRCESKALAVSSVETNITSIVYIINLCVGQVKWTRIEEDVLCHNLFSIHSPLCALNPNNLFNINTVIRFRHTSTEKFNRWIHILSLKKLQECTNCYTPTFTI